MYYVDCVNMQVYYVHLNMQVYYVHLNMQAYYVHLNMQVYYVDHVNILCPPCKCIMLIYVDHVRI